MVLKLITLDGNFDMLSFTFSLQHSIVHRDLKLENILLDGNKQPKVGNSSVNRLYHFMHGMLRRRALFGNPLPTKSHSC